MPRANRYFLEGHAVHITHRCHDRKRLFRSRQDRTAYREKLREHFSRSESKILGYAITRNHVHLLVMPTSKLDLSSLMQKVQGEFAQAYNAKHDRTGAFWTDRYHSTMIETDTHLWKCLRYIDLNMVRAGVVDHPDAWDWCGYSELIGKRTRYCLIDLNWWLHWAGVDSLEEFQASYETWVEEGIASKEVLCRDDRWTESIAVGSKRFVDRFEDAFDHRIELKYERRQDNTWTVRETGEAYRTENR